MSKFTFAFIALGLVGFSGLASENPLYHLGNRLDTVRSGDAYLSKVQPILSSRCVSCHGCYEAPCQLNLESYEGLRRGFSPVSVFSASRLAEMKPTRRIDGPSVAQWRAQGFHPVVSSKGDQPEGEGEAVEDSLFSRMLSQGSKQNAPGFLLAPLSKLQEDVLGAVPQCVASSKQWNDHFGRSGNNAFSVKSVDTFFSTNPGGGMPFALPKLEDDTASVLNQWLAQGAHGPSKAASDDLDRPSRPAVIAAWEDFLNGNSTKEQQTARYIYEHVFTAHLYIEENPGEFFELVRSRTLTGPIQQVATPLPYDPPGTDRVYYRLKKFTRAIVEKTHLVWRLNDARLAHFKDLFLNAPEWRNANVPAPDYGSPNPFKYFSSIPARVRSQFMMENARIIVAGMTQGSVCVGSTATYAIADHFWAWFLRPESDPSVTNPMLGLDDVDVFATAPLPWQPKNNTEWAIVARLDRLTGIDIEIAKTIVKEYHRMTGTKPDPSTAQTFEDIALRLHQHGLKGLDILGAIHHYFRTTKANRAYQEHYELSLRQMLRSKGRNSLSIHDLWNGDKDSSYPNGNPNSWLNITRHGRSATVQYGMEGGNPGSIWVLSYSNFERLYYNLVASYKEWGSVLHKMATWRHMSYVRLEGEDLAISFLPLEYRKEVRARFTRGIGMLKNVMAFPQWSIVGMNERRHWNPLAAWDLPPRPSPYRYKDADSSIHYLVGAVKARLDAVSSDPPDSGLSMDRVAFETKLEALMGRSEVKTREKFAQFLPSISYLVVNGSDGQPWVSTMLADRGYKAHNVMLAESINRDPSHDTLSVYRGFVGHYPNVFFHIDAANVDGFLTELRALNSEAAGKRFEAKWGVARNSQRFWPFFDWLHAYKSRPSPGVDPVEQGIVDLSQYDFF